MTPCFRVELLHSAKLRLKIFDVKKDLMDAGIRKKLRGTSILGEPFSGSTGTCDTSNCKQCVCIACRLRGLGCTACQRRKALKKQVSLYQVLVVAADVLNRPMPTLTHHGIA